MFFAGCGTRDSFATSTDSRSTGRIHTPPLKTTIEGISCGGKWPRGSRIIFPFDCRIAAPYRKAMVACGILDSMRLNSNASKPLFCRVKRKCDGNMSVGKWGRARCSENPFHADGDEVVANAFAQQHRERDAQQIGSHEAQGHDDGIADAGNKREKAHERTFSL